GYGLAGVGGLIAAAGLLINSATISATALGVSPALVGALAVAIGTSLPELAVNIKSALKGETAMAVGNILGSNIFNILVVGGAVGLAGASVPPEFGPHTSYGLLNMAAFGASAGLLTAALMTSKGAITRVQGAIGVGLYAAFTAASIAMGGAAPAVDAAPLESAIIEIQPAINHFAIQDYSKGFNPV
ncbi:MAG: hypothetical protein KJ667_06485, partial [Alphaproteobacteria bacterium]|nr:hypothetical protein [Alphaproteobacteria bacterium]